MAELVGQKISLAQTRQINTELGVDVARIVLSSASLNTKAVRKLGDGPWWVTDRALQQSTPWQVARLKARWFAAGPVYDLCCGLGGDAIHLAQDHDVTAVDAAAEVCLMAHENLRCHAKRKFVVLCGDATAQAIPREARVHLDPDRRTSDVAVDARRSRNQGVGEKRRTDPHAYSPSWDEVQKIMANVAGGVVKLAPASIAPPIQRSDVHRVWISLASVVREQSMLVGDAVNRFRDAAQADTSLGDPMMPSWARCGAEDRSAAVVAGDGTVSYFCPGDRVDETDAVPSVGQPSGWMVDPDAAIRGAGLTQAFARDFGLGTLGGLSGFLTGDVDAGRAGGLAICERIVWHGSCDNRRLRRELRARNFYPWRVKTRGVSHDPNRLAKQFRDCGDQPCSLWMGRIGKRNFAVMTQADG